MFLVEDIEGRQTDVRDFLLGENYRCGVLSSNGLREFELFRDGRLWLVWVCRFSSFQLMLQSSQFDGRSLLILSRSLRIWSRPLLRYMLAGVRFLRLSMATPADPERSTKRATRASRSHSQDTSSSPDAGPSHRCRSRRPRPPSADGKGRREHAPCHGPSVIPSDCSRCSFDPSSAEQVVVRGMTSRCRSFEVINASSSVR